MTDCVFCKIIAGEIPSCKVYEDEQAIAILDITQVTPGHTLLIPKRHYRNLLEMDAASTAELFSLTPSLATKILSATGASGLNIVNNNEEPAGQTVFHTHIHFLPRYQEGDDFDITFTAHEPDFEKMASLAEKIAKS
ncbi:Histidine triad (HIT) nucleotide-binding protein [Streptococcus sp. DD10]|uniref:HIT family protein n=1 Tax=Streptococcus sp. DD10 TaxID=1777878 RepID=UPI000791F917|nr:HIT family protein [Streptococcus sp. DD10]KXT73563.1 Histidine triad (HIT) nucleotide-binding protein [Streptococcus sp. DD10]